jgi:hypothetical protein
MENTIPVGDPRQLGHVIRAVRGWQRLRQDQVGRFSHSFIGEVEMGKPTAQIGKVLEALRELGLKVHVELPHGLDRASFERLSSERK